MISGDGMDSDGFDIQKQRAIERMRELNSRSKNTKVTAQNRQNGRQTATIDFLPHNTPFKIPILDGLGSDPDISLILGLLLLLYFDSTDKLLLLALVYILL